MSGDIQPRKRKGKGKKKDEADDEVLEVKGKAVANNSHKTSNNSSNSSNGEGGGGGESSGIVAKIIFLILLVSLSIVIGLILIELRGKHASFETPVVVLRADEQVEPDIPSPDIPVEEEPIPVPPAPTLEPEVEEEFEAFEATPPLEEYMKVVEEEVVLETPEEPEEEEVITESEPPPVEEVVEIVEEIPLEVVEEILEEAAAEVLEEAAEVIGELEEKSAPVEDEVAAPEDDVEEAEEVVEEEEAVPEVEVVVEDAGDVEEAEAPPVKEIVEDLSVAETLEEVDAPVEQVEESIPEEPATEEDEESEEEAEETDGEPTEAEEEKDEYEEETEDGEYDEDSDEDWSQYGKEGGAGALTDAYLRVETLAEEVLRLEPENSMVSQLAPHLSGVLRAMEEGRTEGLLDTLSHIQVILEDVKKRIEEDTPTEAPVEEEIISKRPERERVFPLDPVEVPEEVVADIEEQVIPHKEVPVVEEEDIPIPSLTETVSLPEKTGGEPVDEVIPDPVYIKPLQESTPEEVVADEAPSKKKAATNNNFDANLQGELDAAEKLLSENPRDALNSFGAILMSNPKSARALYGRAQSLDRLAELERSNSKLEQAIITYRGVLDLADEDPSIVPLPLVWEAAEKCIDRMRFRGFHGKAVRVQQRLLQRFPDDIKLRNQIGVSFLLMNQPTAAKDVFEAVLEKWPHDGFAQVHFGFILKTSYNNNVKGAEYMKKGIESGAEGTQDGRFFFHLGDALQREGLTEEAYEVYDRAVEKGLFLNRYQRSLYNVDRLSSQPVWSIEETSHTEFFRKLEANWEVIRDEGVALLSETPQDGYRPEAENLQDRGDWKQYELFSRGRKITANCVKAPKTCALIEDFPPAAGCKRGQVKFSVMQPKTHVHAHTGPTNCRLRSHLGLVIPTDVHLRVGNNMLTWEEGKILIFDDSWEHEVWHNGMTIRLVLIVDIWHPEINDQEKKSLAPI